MKSQTNLFHFSKCISIFKRKLIFVPLVLLSIIVSVKNLHSYINNGNYSIEELVKSDVVVEENGNNEWIINGNVVQYSSFVIYEDVNTIKIDVLALFNKDVFKSVLYDNIKCVFKTKNDLKLYIASPIDILSIAFMPMNDMPTQLWRFQFKYTFEEADSSFILSNSSLFRVSVIDINEFRSWSSQLSIENVKYQQPVSFNSMIPKKKAVAHCVHMIRDLDDVRLSRMLTWLDLQRKIGIQQIRLYMFNVSDHAIKTISEKYTENNIRIILHKTSFNDVCKWEIKMHKMNPQSSVYKKLYDNCKLAHETHFERISSDDLVSNAHERINTNDCYYNYKYEYEYVSNYDFDEIILPRKLDKQTLDCDNAVSVSKAYTYDIYEYANSLFNKFGKRQTSCISFENVAFLPNNENLETFLQALSSNTEKSRELQIKNQKDKHVTYRIDNLEYSKSVFKASELYKCLKNRYKNITSRVNDKWNNAIGSLMNMREGKSIFNTDNTYGLNQHYSSNERIFTNRKKVPLELGSSSHFRESVDGFFINQKYSIRHLIVDIDYYLFLINNI